MRRSLRPFAACALVLAVNFCLAVRGQDSPAPSPAPSLGDVARQAQAQKDKDKNKDKSNPPAKKVFTNDDFPSGAGAGSSSTNPGAGRVVLPGGQPAGRTAGQPRAPGNPVAAAQANPADQLAQMGSLLGQLDSLDRATLAKNVLQGNEANFPGRAAWEEKLFAAKQLFVAQEREILTKANQFAASSKGIPDMQNANDPRAKALSDQLDQLMQEAQRSSAAFQAVVAEGKELAGQSAAH
jgi:hypothetical protein